MWILRRTWPYFLCMYHILISNIPLLSKSFSTLRHIQYLLTIFFLPILAFSHSIFWQILIWTWFLHLQLLWHLRPFLAPNFLVSCSFFVPFVVWMCSEPSGLHFQFSFPFSPVFCQFTGGFINVSETKFSNNDSPIFSKLFIPSRSLILFIMPPLLSRNSSFLWL